MNSSWSEWMCGGTKVPGGNSACQEKEDSLTCLGTYVCPRMFQAMLSMPLPALVTPAFIAFMEIAPLHSACCSTHTPAMSAFQPSCQILWVSHRHTTRRPSPWSQPQKV